MVPKRYERNMETFTPEELTLVKKSHVCVIGCGGLGGYVINSLARFGVGTLTIVDGDRFSESNLNRQLFASAKTLDKNKAIAAMDELKLINPEIAVRAHPVMLTAENAAELLDGCTLAVDCLDSISARHALADACETLGIPLIHGAISGLYGQVACIYPGDRLFERLYPGSANQSPNSLGNPVFAPQLVASVQSCEAVKILAGRETALRNAVLYIDLHNCDFEVISFS